VKVDFLSPAEPTGFNGAAYPPFDRQPFAVDSIWVEQIWENQSDEQEPLQYRANVLPRRCVRNIGKRTPQ